MPAGWGIHRRHSDSFKRKNDGATCLLVIYPDTNELPQRNSGEASASASGRAHASHNKYIFSLNVLLLPSLISLMLSQVCESVHANLAKGTMNLLMPLLVQGLLILRFLVFFGFYPEKPNPPNHQFIMSTVPVKSNWLVQFRFFGTVCLIQWHCEQPALLPFMGKCFKWSCKSLNTEPIYRAGEFQI